MIVVRDAGIGVIFGLSVFARRAAEDGHNNYSACSNNRCCRVFVEAPHCHDGYEEKRGHYSMNLGILKHGSLTY